MFVRVSGEALPTIYVHPCCIPQANKPRSRGERGEMRVVGNERSEFVSGFGVWVCESKLLTVLGLSDVGGTEGINHR